MRQMTTRLLRHWARATDIQRTEGATWYLLARAEAQRLAKLHGVTLQAAAGVIAALSPRLHWTANVRAAHKLLDGQDVPGVFLASLRKAQRIAAGEPPLTVLGGPKVRAFYRAIMGEDAAVVDVWIARAAGVKDAPSAREYELVARALTRAAERVGVPVHVFQATTWVAVRGRA